MATVNSKTLFPGVDLSKISSDPNFKEDSVRETIILPLLNRLGYQNKNIIRSQTLKHPYLRVGSNKKIPLKLIPDYSIKIEESYAWILDAKSPSEKSIAKRILNRFTAMRLILK
jgi:hypothetical protein